MICAFKCCHTSYLGVKLAEVQFFICFLRVFAWKNGNGPSTWKKMLGRRSFPFGAKGLFFLGGVCCQFQGGYFFFNSESSEIMEKHLNNAEFQARVFWPRMNRGGTGSRGKKNTIFTSIYHSSMFGSGRVWGIQIFLQLQKIIFLICWCFCSETGDLLGIWVLSKWWDVTGFWWNVLRHFWAWNNSNPHGGGRKSCWWEQFQNQQLVPDFPYHKFDHQCLFPIWLQVMHDSYGGVVLTMHLPSLILKI